MTCEGRYEFCLCEKKCLAVHGSLQDVYWKSVNPDGELCDYEKYDYVFRDIRIFRIISRNIINRKTKKEIQKEDCFLNPGSVGQPRNHNSAAQFAILDSETEEIHFVKVEYDIEKEQSLYNGEIDDFYKNRLKEGV